jgi:hypothetical protein
MITITGPKSLTLPAALGGNAQIYELTLACVTRGLFVEDYPGAETVRISGMKDTTLVSLPIVQLLVSKGADLEGYPVFFEISNINSVCPFSTKDPKETWETWGVFGESHKPVKLGNKWYRSNNVGESGEPLKASVFLNAGVPILSVTQYQAIQQANSKLTDSMPT